MSKTCCKSSWTKCLPAHQIITCCFSQMKNKQKKKMKEKNNMKLKTNQISLLLFQNKIFSLVNIVDKYTPPFVYCVCCVCVWASLQLVYYISALWSCSYFYWTTDWNEGWRRPYLSFILLHLHLMQWNSSRWQRDYSNST